ncbi:glyoxylate/hydroxypyruvate reductase A [Microvirga sp. VF16]|uniref:2-hydroxyacid dehydrogenase n=1 Tax=Microvirga sp. VF16 TaxID=2807101 RepID=UPI00193E00E2|nr:glyoxylate/hydroxypyruvate reductase A [Microvirga sp. VF16]QRM33060.1 glyoxylate/hydroxypyruvate reductase A [Microvirga sp. VF16]
MTGVGKQGGTILFHSEVSDKAWPIELQKAFPEFRVCTQLSDAVPTDVVAAVVWNPPPGMFEALTGLRLIQVLGAGVDKFLSDDRLPKGVPIARLVDPGLTARMTEYVLMHSLALHRQMPDLQRAQREHRWTFIHPTPPERTCIGILGLGVLGTSCARALTSAGFTVVGWSRSRKEGLDFPSYAGLEELDQFKQQADIIVLLLPLTRETEDLVDESFLATVKSGAALINVGRGKLVVDNALIRALDAGLLRHAILDVFRTEPLPFDHPFWDHPKITITPHNSSATNPATALDQVIVNIRRALAAEPLQHQVDPAHGY